MISGLLPRDHLVVRHLLRDVERSITDGRLRSMLVVWVWSTLPSDARRTVRETVGSARASFDGLTPAQRERVKQYRERWIFLTSSTILLGSWLGMLSILRFVVPAMRDAARQGGGGGPSDRVRVETRQVRVTLRVAADRAATDTWLGRRSREFLSQEFAARSNGGPKSTQVA